MKTQSLLWALLCLGWPSVAAQAQTPTAAEHEENATRLAATTGRERLALLVELTYKYHNSDPKPALAYGEEALDLLNTWGDDEQRWKLFAALAWINYYDGNYASGLRYARTCEQLARADGDPQALVRSLRAVAFNQSEAGDARAALATFNEALALSQEIDNYQLGGILVAIGAIYQKLGDLEEGLKYQHRAYRHFEELGDSPRGVAVALGNVAGLYETLGRSTEAIEFFARSLEILRQSGDRRNSALVLNDLGDIHRETGDLSLALELHRQSLAIFEDLGLRPYIADTLGHLGGDHLALGELDQASVFYRRSLALWEEEGDPVQAAGVLTKLGKLLRERGDFEAARQRLEQAVTFYDEAELEVDLDQAHEEAVFELAETYRALGRDRRALQAFKRHEELLIARLEDEKGRNLAEMQVRFDVDLKEKEIELLEQERQLQAFDLERQRDSRRALLVVFALSLLVLGLVFNRSRLKTRQAMMLQTVEQERAVSARLRQVDKLKDEFLANTSHELRTPLYGMTGLAESLIDGAGGELPEAAKAHLAMVVASGRRLTTLVNDVLDFSKLKHRSLELAAKPVDLHPVVDVVLTLLRPLVGSKDLDVENAIAADGPPVLADEDRLQQILHNLVGNAIKFTEAGAVVVAAVANGGRLEISVRDTGPGIPEEQQERIFDAFAQADGTIEREFGGSGLGLAVTRQLVELHGGNLRVESATGQGSTFTFDLPIVERRLASETSPSEVTAPLAEPASAPPPVAIESDDVHLLAATVPEPIATAAGPSVLVVDDEPVNRQVLVNHLGAAGYRITQAASGSEALRAIEQQLPDLILLDVMMPRMSGYEVCRSLRQRFPLEELPVLFLTAKSQPADLVVGLAAGANDYLPKPIAKAELLARVETHLALRSVHHQLSELVMERTAQVAEREQLLAERQRLISELEAKNAELARFNYTVSHDLKNPLTTIQNFLGLARRDAAEGETDRLEHDFDRLQNAAGKLRQLLDELFELSRLELQANTLEDVAFGDLVRSALAKLESVLTERGAVVEVAPDLPMVRGDRQRLEELIRHLIDNALRYAEDAQTPRIEIGSRSEGDEPADHGPIFYVRDHGIGIEPRYHERIFDLFERLGPETSDGTGIGLALAKRIVETHGGRIWVESQGRGCGSEFCFVLADTLGPPHPKGDGQNAW